MSPVQRVALLPSPGCRVECRLELHVEDQRPLGLGAEEGAAPCPRCRAQQQVLAGNRLLAPLRPAAGKRRGMGRALETCGWEEALGRLASALDEVRRGRLGLTWIAAGSHPRASEIFPLRACSLLGHARFVQSRTPTERIARWAAGRIGDEQRALPGDLSSAHRVMVWGADPATGPAALRRAFVSAIASPVVVDPAASASSRGCALHLALRPGTDLALALGLLCALGHGEDPRAGSWSLPRTAEVCNLPLESIRKAVRVLGETARPGVLVVGAGLLAATGDTRGLDAAAAVARALDLRLILPHPAPDPAAGFPMPQADSGGKQSRRTIREHAWRLDTADAAREVVIIEGGDPLSMWDEGDQVREWLEQARLVVVLGGPENTAARHADFVLPTPDGAEQLDAAGLNWEEAPRVGGGALPQPRGVRSVRAIWAALARRLDLAGNWFGEIDPAVAAGLRPAQGHGGMAPEPPQLPPHREVGEGPLSTPRTRDAFRLQLVLARRLPAGAETGAAAPAESSFCLGQEEARSRGLRDGQQVVVHNDRGQREGRLLVGRQPPGVLVGVHPPIRPGDPGLSALLPRDESGMPSRLPCLVEVSPLRSGGSY